MEVGAPSGVLAAWFNVYCGAGRVAGSVTPGTKSELDAGWGRRRREEGDEEEEGAA